MKAKWPNGTVVEIIGADNSGPTEAMYKLIGKKGKITEFSSNGDYKVIGWWWNPKDFKVLDYGYPSTEFLFDAKNLVIEDSNV